MRILSRCLSALLVLYVLAPWSPAVWGQKAEQGDPKKGREKFQQYCAVCHGKRGLGDGPMANATTPAAPRLTTKEVRAQSDEEIFNAIANGVGTTMPAWRGLLNEQQLLDMLAYVRALSG